jgi:hypothetical protein
MKSDDVFKRVVPKKSGIPVIENTCVLGGFEYATNLEIWAKRKTDKPDGLYKDGYFMPKESVEDFPNCECRFATEGEVRVIDFTPEDIDMICEAAKYISKDESRPVLQSVAIINTVYKTMICGTDGIRLFKYDRESALHSENFLLYLDTNVLKFFKSKQVSRIEFESAGETDEDDNIATVKLREIEYNFPVVVGIRFNIEDCSLVIPQQKYSQNYPDVLRVIPSYKDYNFYKVQLSGNIRKQLIDWKKPLKETSDQIKWFIKNDNTFILQGLNVDTGWESLLELPYEPCVAMNIEPNVTRLLMSIGLRNGSSSEINGESYPALIALNRTYFLDVAPLKDEIIMGVKDLESAVLFG